MLFKCVSIRSDCWGGLLRVPQTLTIPYIGDFLRHDIEYVLSSMLPWNAGISLAVADIFFPTVAIDGSFCR